MVSTTEPPPRSSTIASTSSTASVPWPTRPEERGQRERGGEHREDGVVGQRRGQVGALVGHELAERLAQHVAPTSARRAGWGSGACRRRGRRYAASPAGRPGSCCPVPRPPGVHAGGRTGHAVPGTNRRARSCSSAARAALLPQRAVDAAAGVRGGRAEVEAGDPGLGPAEPGDRAEDQLLVQLGGAAVDRAADEVGVAGLELARPEDPRASTRDPKPGASRSIRACIRSANRSQSSRSQSPGCCRRPRRARSPAARGCRPTATRCRPGERVGSVVVIWPVSRNGAAGTAPARHLAQGLGHLADRVGDVHRARARTPAAAPRAPVRPAPSRP